MKLVVLDSYTAVSTDLSLDGLKKYVDELVIYERTLPEDTANRIGGAEMVLTNKTVISREIIEQCPNLRYIGVFATGYNIIDIDCCREKGIVVSNAPSYSTSSVAQYTFSFMLEFFSMVGLHNAEVHEGKWCECKDFSFYDPRISELSGKTLGLVGFGSIARKVAQIAAAFDMNILVYTRTKYPEFENEHLRFVDFDSLLTDSNIISLHCPLFPETAKLINSEAVGRMKDGAVLINTARGGVIDEQAVADGLNSGKLRGYGTDVALVEPISPDNPLLKAKNCVITPHIAWATRESRERLIQIVEQNIKAFCEGDPINNVAGR